MRQIDTTRFGMIDIDEQKIINFPMEIPGFEENREFVMIPYEAPFVFLQSVTSSDLAFMMINPFIINITVVITHNMGPSHIKK